MSKVKRKNHTSDFKAKVAIEAIRGIQTVNEIGQENGVHPTQGRQMEEVSARTSFHPV